MKKIIICLTIVSAIFFSSCEKVKDFGTINQSPIATPYNTDQAMRSVMVNLGANTVWYSGLTRTGALYCQYFSETQYTDASRYVVQNIDWDGLYAGPIFECQNIINSNGTAKPNQTAVARILKAYYFAFLTDMYGDLPYSEALKGNGIIPYDKQQTIYPALLTELKAANTQFAGSGVGGDLMFAGDVSKWKKFANSLRMLLALRWVKIDPNAAQAAFLDAYNDAAGHITANSENAEFQYTGGGNYPNPFHQYYAIDQRNDYGVSTTFMNVLSNTNDKRRDVWTTSTIGFPYGLPREQAVLVAPTWSRMLNASVRTQSSKMYLLTACYVDLLKAEAALRGWIALNPQTLYESAITKSWAQWGVGTPAELTTYLTNANINFATAADNTARLNRVYLQYWVSNFPSGWHGYADMRRTDFPVLAVAPSNGNKPIPKRIPYGPNERTLNFPNFSTASATYTVNGEVNSQDAPVAWDR